MPSHAADKEKTATLFIDGDAKDVRAAVGAALDEEGLKLKEDDPGRVLQSAIEKGERSPDSLLRWPPTTGEIAFDVVIAIAGGLVTGITSNYAQDHEMTKKIDRALGKAQENLRKAQVKTANLIKWIVRT
jgi:hypothetical protein